MISEEQLDRWERHYKAGSISKYRYETEHMPALIAEVRRLRAELDKVSDERSDFGVIGYFQGRSDARDRVRQLENKINKLVAMVDYLAQQCAGLTYELYAEKAVGDFHDNPEVKPAYWRQEAHEAANNDG